MENIVEKLEKTISSHYPKVSNEDITRFEQADETFNNLVDAGLLKKRGYTLSTIDHEKEVLSYNKRK